MAIGRREFVVGSLAASIGGRLSAIRAMSSPAAADDVASTPITGVKVGTAVKLDDNQGDTWIAAWAGDDNLYSPSDDTSGFRKACSSNVAFNRIEGSDPLHLTGTTINPMSEYANAGQVGPDGCTWKSTGCMWIDGALYLSVARHLYGDDSGDPEETADGTERKHYQERRSGKKLDAHGAGEL